MDLYYICEVCGKKAKKDMGPSYAYCECCKKFYPLSKEKSIIIHEVTEQKEVDSFNAILSELRKVYPELVPDRIAPNAFIKKILPSKISQKCTIRNQTYNERDRNGVEFPVPRADIYLNNNPTISSALTNNQRLAISGKLKTGELIIDDIMVIDDPIKRSDDIDAEVTFYLGSDGKGKTNYLKEITKEPPKERETRSQDIASWNDYLDWKHELAKLRIRALKYIAFDFNITKRQMTFLVVITDGSELSNFERYLKRDDTAIFPNYYSKNRYIFHIKTTDSRQDSEAGISLEYVKTGRIYNPEDVDLDRWNRYYNNAKRYKSNDTSSREEDLNFVSILKGVEYNYKNEYLLAEIVFNLSDNADLWIKQTLKKSGILPEDVESQLAEEFYPDGFIATSQVGDFALIRRLKRAIADYVSGRSASQGLDQWLFDIKKARPVTETARIQKWQNKALNDRQKTAVKKILATQDVCLIQGPPGTGKTTVIAEAVYQLVHQHKRVLIASQANLAVDNALERLIADPTIRAIRLGNLRKIDASVSNITEENVLSTFYNTLIGFIDTQYLAKWKTAEDTLNDLDKEINVVKKTSGEIISLQNRIAKLKSEMEDFASIRKYRFSYINQKKTIDCLKMVISFCERGTDSFEIPSDGDWLNSIIEETRLNLLSLNKIGISICPMTLRSNDVESDKKEEYYKRKCELILNRSVAAKDLYEKLMKSDLSDELILQKQEEILRSRLGKGDTSILQEWMEIYKKLEFQQNQRLTRPAYVLSEKEKNLFEKDNIDAMSAISVLKNAKADIDSILEIVLKQSNKRIGENESLLETISAAIEEYEKKKNERGEQLKNLQEQFEKKKSEISSIRTKYEIDEADIIGGLERRKEGIKNELFSVAKKEDWEDIFEGFKQWVSKIPDYKNERDLSLDSYVNGCNVVGVSCTENSRTLTEKGFKYFDVVIIDEVSKATPPELLIPMLKGRKVVLVGDHRQLPPLFNEHEASYQEVVDMQNEFADLAIELKKEDFSKYKQMVTSSLFQQYFESADSSIKETLNYQYRMHSDIMSIVNNFYDGQLRDGNAIGGTGEGREHLLTIDSALGTEMIVSEKHAYWIDSSSLCDARIYEHREAGSKSAANILEAYIIAELVKKIDVQYMNTPQVSQPVSVGIISFYHEQVDLLRGLISNDSYHSIDVEINTVDRFQGKEKEIILVSLVRNSKNAKHGTDSFIAAFQRMNVAFSRAQKLLVIVGAKDMYLDQPVVISNMNDGTPNTVMAYKEIIEMLRDKAAFFIAEDVLPEKTVMDVLDLYRKEKGAKK